MARGVHRRQERGHGETDHNAAGRHCHGRGRLRSGSRRTSAFQPAWRRAAARSAEKTRRLMICGGEREERAADLDALCRLTTQAFHCLGRFSARFGRGRRAQLDGGAARPGSASLLAATTAFTSGSIEMAPSPRRPLAAGRHPFRTPTAASTRRGSSRHSKQLLADGAHGLAILGTTSEANSLTLDERRRVIDAHLEAGIPAERLLPGTGRLRRGRCRGPHPSCRRDRRSGGASPAAVLLQEGLRRRALRLRREADRRLRQQRADGSCSTISRRWRWSAGRRN